MRIEFSSPHEELDTISRFTGELLVRARYNYVNKYEYAAWLYLHHEQTLLYNLCRIILKQFTISVSNHLQ